MASSKMMPSSSATSRKSDLSRRSSTKSSSISEHRSHTIKNYRRKAPNQTQNHLDPMTVDGLLNSVYGESSATAESKLLDAEITLVDAGDVITNGDAPLPFPPATVQESFSSTGPRTVDDVWNEIVAGRSDRKECKVEVPEEMMTLEDFLAKAGAVDEEDVKMPPVETLSGGIFAFDPIPPTPYQSQPLEGSAIGFGNGVEVMAGRSKRKAIMEPLDKAAQQRQRRMIKNRESAARSRERKQAYQNDLEQLAARLEEENERLLQEKAERTKERRKQLMENLVPVVENRKPARVLRRVRSMQW